MRSTEIVFLMREAPNYELAIMMQSMEETEGKHSDADGRNVG